MLGTFGIKGLIASSSQHSGTYLQTNEVRLIITNIMSCSHADHFIHLQIAQETIIIVVTRHSC